MSRNLRENQDQGRKTQTVIDELLETQCGQALEIKAPEGPSHWGCRGGFTLW